MSSFLVHGHRQIWLPPLKAKRREGLLNQRHNRGPTLRRWATPALAQASRRPCGLSPRSTLRLAVAPSSP